MNVCDKCHEEAVAPIGSEVESEEKKIISFLHCKKCLEESGDSPYEQDIEVGFTGTGIQVWCRRHQMNIAHLVPPTSLNLPKSQPS